MRVFLGIVAALFGVAIIVFNKNFALLKESKNGEQSSRRLTYNRVVICAVGLVALAAGALTAAGVL
ncbi:hypothetical protein CU254_27255 [Amycolatopsis sp. AA4]|uniref:hypothetical protein n=1 Tax=Actinomycetes TaxID=1760 RepID=UPI0001B56B68|nr:MULTISPECIES: hypothetical protein [Actinomycetes]ATY13717.1 hypothetical protein CU254_27255 [Amycolatopsis sp. AA4]EFL09697.1 predicted protein [Streptomyces sp. AA4]